MYGNDLWQRRQRGAIDPRRSPWRTERCRLARVRVTNSTTQCGGRGERSRPIRVRTYCRPVRKRRLAA
jgi:hypothetical protein